MTSLYVRKPRKVRSVYARPRAEHGEAGEHASGDREELAGDGEGSVGDRSAGGASPQSSRPTACGKASPVDRADQDQAVKRSSGRASGGWKREGRGCGAKSRKEGGDGSHSTAQSSVDHRSSVSSRSVVRGSSVSSRSVVKGSSVSRKSCARKAGGHARLESSVSKGSSTSTKSSPRKAGRPAKSTGSVSNKPPVSELDKSEEDHPASTSESDDHRKSPACVKTKAVELSAPMWESPVGTESFVSHNTLSLLKHKIREKRPSVKEPPQPSSQSQSLSRLKPFACAVCQRRYSSDAGLRHHQRVLHPPGAGSADDTLPTAGHAPPRFQCHVCGKVFRAKSTLARHRPVHSEVKPFVCEACGKSFTQAANLRAHMLQHTGERPFVCDVCHKTYLNNFDLQQHKRVHTGEKPFVCNTCGKAFMKMEYLKIHKQVHSDVRPYRCNQCSKTFRRSSQLKAHKSTHTGVKAFECETCAKRFSTKAVLKKHAHIHARQKDPSASGSKRMPYICDVCGAEISKKSSFRIHMMTHTGERPYVCDLCSRGYITKNELVIHRRSHTGERPFVCHVCSFSFPRNSDLRRHVSTIHLGRKPHACELCGKAFSDRRTLKEHKFTHLGIRPHKCPDCGKCFTQAGSLKSHMRTHTGEKPFACKQCSKRFADIGGRSRHMRIHTGEKPYKCTLCPAVFARPEPYKHHRESVHGVGVAKATGVQSRAGRDQTTALSEGVEVVPDTYSTAPHSAGNAAACQFVTCAQTAEVLHFHSAQPPCLTGPVVQMTETLVVPAASIPPASVVESSPGLPGSSGSGAAGATSGKEDWAYTPETSVIYQPVSSSYTRQHQSSGSEVVEYTIIEDPGSSVAQLSHDTIVEHPANAVSQWSQVSSSRSVVMDLGVDQSPAVPRIIEVQVQQIGEGVPPKILRVKVDTSGMPGLPAVTSDRDCSRFSPTPAEDGAGEDMIYCAGEEAEVEPSGQVSGAAVTALQSGHVEVLASVTESSLGSDYAQGVTSPAASVVVDSQTISLHAETLGQSYDRVLFRPADALQQDCGCVQRASHVDAGPRQESAVSGQGASGLVTVLHPQVSAKGAVRTAVVSVGGPQTGDCHTNTTTTSVTPHPCPPEFIQVYHSDGTEGLAILQPDTLVNADLSKSLLDHIQASQTDGAPGPRVIDLHQVDAIQIMSQVPGTSDRVTHDGTALVDEKTSLESLDSKPGDLTPAGRNYNTNRRFNKKHKPTSMKMDASEFGDILQTRKRTPRGKGKKEWMCEVCGKGFTHHMSLKNHMAVQHQRGQGPGFVCDICSKACYSRTVLVAHRRRHTGERPFACEHCPNTYKHKSDLRQHILAAHLGVRPHVCEVCGQTFTERHSLKDHRLIHAGVKPHTCPTCGKAFTQASSLRTHLRTHSGARPWVCQFCGKGFSDQSAFTRHQRIHTGEKPFVCDRCPAAFARSEQLKKHHSKDHAEDLHNLATLAAVVATMQ
ncbi:hypothetical protein ACOMHN_002849 [Nucella lapillus]